jgi:hypothetical protein
MPFIAGAPIAQFPFIVFQEIERHGRPVFLQDSQPRQRNLFERPELGSCHSYFPVDLIE